MAFVTQYMTDRRIQLGRESFVRKFVWGTNWRKIKVGLLWAINDTFTTVYGAGLKVGVAAGDQFGFDSPNIIDYVGFQHHGNWNGVDLTRVTSNGQPAFNIGGSLSGRKVGPTITVGSNNSSTSGYVGVVQSGILTGYTATITKLSDGYDIQGYCYGNGGLAQISRYDFIASCESDTNIGSWGNLANSWPTIPYAASLHPFDSLCVSWTRSVPTIEIGEIIVTRHY